MILTLTPNPALDITYEVGSLSVHGEHRVRRVRAAAGGKGVNVARVLAQLGDEAICAGPLGGGTGEELQALLSSTPLRQEWTPVHGSTRRTVTIVDAAGATAFNEPGPELSAEEIAALTSDLSGLLEQPGIRAVTISGSLPPGLSTTDLASFIGMCRKAGRPVLIDTSGAALMAAARAGATMLKPNASEALSATGASTPLEATLLLVAEGARRVVCSLGADGMLGVDDAAGTVRAWRASLKEPLPGNPTGAGDAAVAALATGALTGEVPLPDALLRAVAVSASAVTRPIAGQIDLALADRLAAHIDLEEIPCP